MKKILYILIAFCASLPVVNAQQAGQIWIGGSVELYTSKTIDSYRAKNYSIMPELGYNIKDNVGVGIRLGYVHKEYDIKTTLEKTDGYTVNPFVRYLFLQGLLGGLFVDGGAAYEYGKNQRTEIITHHIEGGLRPGVVVCVSSKVSLTGRFGFMGYQYEKTGADKTNSFGLDFDLSQIQFGVNVLLW